MLIFLPDRDHPQEPSSHADGSSAEPKLLLHTGEEKAGREQRLIFETASQVLEVLVRSEKKNKKLASGPIPDSLGDAWGSRGCLLDSPVCRSKVSVLPGGSRSAV